MVSASTIYAYSSLLVVTYLLDHALGFLLRCNGLCPHLHLHLDLGASELGQEMQQ